MSNAITVEALSKRFRLQHQAGGSGYSTFRDAFVHGAQRLAGRLRRKGSDGGSGEDFWALRDVSFTIAPGEKVGIIGRNGAGKSTLLKVLSRIIEPTSGKIRIRGRVAGLLEVGTGFHPELTGRENIYFNGSILGMTKAEIRSQFDAIVAFAEVERFLDTPVKHYSSGMYVRLGFAVAAHLEPEIMIIDEVLAVGDARFQKKCLGKLQEIGSQGRTVLFVSHNMSSILQFTQRTLVLQQGRLIEDVDSDAGVMAYLKINEGASRAVALAGQVPWLRVAEFTFDQFSMGLGFNQPLRFKLDLALDHELAEMVINLGLINSIGARIVTAKTILHSLNPNTYRIELEVPDHRLIPGHYFIALTLSSRREVLFSNDQVISIEILADNIDDPLLLPHITRGKDRLGCYCPMLARW